MAVDPHVVVVVIDSEAVGPPVEESTDIDRVRGILDSYAIILVVLEDDVVLRVGRIDAVPLLHRVVEADAQLMRLIEQSRAQHARQVERLLSVGIADRIGLDARSVYDTLVSGLQVQFGTVCRAEGENPLVVAEDVVLEAEVHTYARDRLARPPTALLYCVEVISEVTVVEKLRVVRP